MLGICTAFYDFDKYLRYGLAFEKLTSAIILLILTG